MSKSRRDKKRAHRSAGSAHEPAARAKRGRSSSSFTYWFVRLSPVATALVALAIWWFAKSTQLAAVAGMVGAIAWLTVALSAVGSSVPPRDRTRAGAIDFGKRNSP